MKQNNKIDLYFKFIKENIYECLECKKNVKKLGRGTHYWKVHTEIGKNSIIRKFNRKGTNQYTKAKELGLPKPIVSEKTRKLISEKSKLIKWTPEQKIKHSEIMKKVVEKYPESYSSNNVCGRVKNIKYKDFILKGSWEVEVAKFLDKNNIKWTNKIIPKKYYWNNDYHYYFPDFYLIEYDIYLEIKGYQTDRDLYKWKSLKNLIILKKQEIKKIKQNNFILILNK